MNHIMNGIMQQNSSKKQNVFKRIWNWINRNFGGILLVLILLSIGGNYLAFRYQNCNGIYNHLESLSISLGVCADITIVYYVILQLWKKRIKIDGIGEFKIRRSKYDIQYLTNVIGWKYYAGGNYNRDAVLKAYYEELDNDFKVISAMIQPKPHPAPSPMRKECRLIKMQNGRLVTENYFQDVNIKLENNESFGITTNKLCDGKLNKTQQIEQIINLLYKQYDYSFKSSLSESDLDRYIQELNSDVSDNTIKSILSELEKKAGIFINREEEVLRWKSKLSNLYITREVLVDILSWYYREITKDERKSLYEYWYLIDRKNIRDAMPGEYHIDYNNQAFNVNKQLLTSCDELIELAKVIFNLESLPKDVIEQVVMQWYLPGMERN